MGNCLTDNMNVKYGQRRGRKEVSEKMLKRVVEVVYMCTLKGR